MASVGGAENKISATQIVRTEQSMGFRLGHAQIPAKRPAGAGLPKPAAHARLTELPERLIYPGLFFIVAIGEKYRVQTRTVLNQMRVFVDTIPYQKIVRLPALAPVSRFI